jgi:hypothetical protein
MAIAEWIVIRIFPLAALMGGLVGVVSPAYAEGFRCPPSGKFIEVGDTMAEVEEKCGAPKSKEELFGSICSRQWGCYTVKTGELWIYDFGRTFLTRQLRFQKIYLAQIEEGRYGNKPD